ncbi:unnamed protein product [Heligmosomoides polygyrus]|uniref:GYF domain-containing protein n=1 Tax=Heligmosomoides polygyrus TaxID=6339 RepID=A0A183FPA4_HELPZ|nr:unnamed protein product [Heligmosomoides polygyrus]
MMTKPIEVRWYYHGPDNEIYGPYAAKEMLMWTQSGYFNDSLLIRTEHEERFHTLGEWTRVLLRNLRFSLYLHLSSYNRLPRMSRSAPLKHTKLAVVPPALREGSAIGPSMSNWDLPCRSILLGGPKVMIHPMPCAHISWLEFGFVLIVFVCLYATY